MSKPTFAERCLLAEQCLPDAPYRAMLKKLHAEMLEALAEQQDGGVPGYPAKINNTGPSHSVPGYPAKTAGPPDILYHRLAGFNNTTKITEERMASKQREYEESKSKLLHSSPVQQEPAPVQQETVAWMHEWEDGERIPMLMGRDDRNQDEPKTVRPLVYGDTSPQPAQQQKPVAGVVLRDGQPTLLQNKHIKETDERLFRAAPQPPAQRTPFAYVWTNSKGQAAYGQTPHDIYPSEPLYK